MGLLLFLAVLGAAYVVTRILADVVKLRWYYDHQHIHHIAYCLVLLPVSWILYEYHHIEYAEVVAAIAYAFIVSEVHLLITPTVTRYVRQIAHLDSDN